MTPEEFAQAFDEELERRANTEMARLRREVSRLSEIYGSNDLSRLFAKGPEPLGMSYWIRKHEVTTHYDPQKGIEYTTMHDSGERQAFDTGAVRDAAEGKPRLELVSPFMEERLGLWLEAGARKYEDRNWEKGIPFSRCIASLKRHVMRFQMGLKDEDHLAAIVCNAMFLMHYQEMIERGVLPESLNDMPGYCKEGDK
jgi:hypothetical protein